MKIAVLSASPRPDGNSRALAAALATGAHAAGHEAAVVDLNHVMTGFLRDCRHCRRPDGQCSIDDGYADLIHDTIAPADAIVLATPLYFYGMAAAMKNYIDRLVCYTAASYPRSAEVVEALIAKRCALLISSEEDYPTAISAVVAQVQEMCRYLRQDFVAVVHGIGNHRGEIRRDPADPLAAARSLGERMFTRHHSDYTLTTERSNTVW